jgi:hypothetical protein
MVENDKENYLSAVTSAGPALALAVMSQRFESMPGNFPTRIPDLSIDAFRAPYTGWYKARFSCQSARQEVTNSQPVDKSGALILDGFYFVITCRKSNRLNTETIYDQTTGESLFNVQQDENSQYLGNVVARSSFVRSGISTPSAAMGFVWLNKGDMVGWHIYTYVANNNLELLGQDLRQYARIVMNDISPSDTRMGYGSPRLYTNGGTGSSPGGSVTSDSINAKSVISNISTPNNNPNRKSFLMVQFAGTGGLPEQRYNVTLEQTLNFDKTPDVLSSVYEV